jgi:serine protease AprX
MLVRPRLIVPFGIVAAVVAATAAAPPGAAATGPTATGPAQRPVAAGVTAGMTDRDHDHVSDDFQGRLRGAAAGARFDVIVTGVGAAGAQHAVGRFRVRHSWSLITGFAARMTVGQARALARRPGVRRVELDRVMHATDDGTISDFGAAGAQSLGYTGAGRTVCIVDTGVDPSHEQLDSKAPVPFHDFIGTSTTAYDDHGHGTHVASIAVGDGVGGSNAARYRGVAPAAALASAKVLDSSGSGADSGVVSGVQWCAARDDADVISMSLGSDIVADGNDALSQAVDAAVIDRGKVVTVAAGNSGDAPGSIGSPAAARQAVTVGAVTEWSGPATSYRSNGISLASFSSRGPTTDGRTKPEVVAPGVTVMAAQAGTTSGYVSFSGTSMATPYVAGAALLGWQAAGAQATAGPAGSTTPPATTAAVAGGLKASAADRGPAGPDNDWGWGLVDVRSYVGLLTATTADDGTTSFPTASHLTGSVPNGGSQSLSIPVSDSSAPLALTVTLAGSLQCTIFCLSEEWSPDLDAELRDPSGTVVATSTCALGSDCGVGRQETLAVRSPVVGNYTLRVYAYNGGPGGGYAVDVSQGPVTGGSPPPPPPPNQPPTAVAGPDQALTVNSTKAKAGFTLDGRGSNDPEGGALQYRWSLGGSTVGTTSTLSQKKSIGTYVYKLTVTDVGGLSASDDVTVVVRRR